MRRKRLLGVLLPLLVLGTIAAAAGAQLTGISVATQGHGTTLTIHANGVFAHTEYRPADNLLLVDLAGVSAAKLDGKTLTLENPGVSSYRVLGFRGASGADVARIELTLAPSAQVKLSEEKGALLVHVTVGNTPGATTPESKPAAPMNAMGAPDKKAQESKAAGAMPVTIHNIVVVRAKDGMEIEIQGSGPMTPRAMKLAAPDRVVIDLPNAVASKGKEIPVNAGEVKSVRMARYQLHPPVIRVVVDLKSAQDFDLVPAGHKLTLKLRAPAAAAIRPATTTATATPAAAPATEKPAAKPRTAPATASATAPAASNSAAAQDFVVVKPIFKPKAEPAQSKQAAAPAQAEPAARAAEAATKFGGPKSEVPLSNGPLVPRVSASMQPMPAVNAALQQQAAQAATPLPSARGPRYTGEPISVNLKDVDLKDFFRLIHEISGLNIVLDPNVKGTLTLVLDDVPWDQALDIVLKNNSLERELDGNVLRIATVETLRREADARRAQQEARALADPKVTVTRFLSYAHSKDVVPTIKKFLSQRGEIISDDRTNALIIQDIPSVFPEIDRLLRELDRKTPEVEIEARVVAATRSFARDIGTQLGFAWGNKPTAVGGAGSVGISPIDITPPASPPPFITNSGGSSIPLFTNMPAIGPTSGLSLNTFGNAYRLDVILTAAESRGLLKILSRPRIVTQNNIQAMVRQGVRIPVVTQGQLAGPATTTYVDAFLRLTVTPQITVENTIFLNIDVENTTPDFSRQVGGNPTLITQQALTQVLVTDGGTVVIGGVIQTQNSVSIQQVPLLGSIPVLGNLFKRRAVSTSTQELIFFITPKIIQT